MVDQSTPDSAANGQNRAGAAVWADHLVVGYHGSSVVQDISFQLGKGKMLALVGQNGSGKSTLLKTIVGLLPPVQGSVETLAARPGSTPKQIAYLSQFHSNSFVLPLQAFDVVEMGRYTVRGLLGRLTAADHDLVRSSMRTMGIDNLATAPLRSLSGGQQQRVYLAQMLARQADLIVLDEPTASLDAAGKEVYARAIECELARGAAVVTATHDIREAARCDLVMLLARRVIALGPAQTVLTPEALLETFGIILLSPGQGGALAIVEQGHEHTCD